MARAIPGYIWHITQILCRSSEITPGLSGKRERSHRGRGRVSVQGGADHYNVLLVAEKGDIAAENTHFWETKVR
jgi:hypothetical protein